MNDSMYPKRYGGMAMSKPDQNIKDPRLYQNQQDTDTRQMNPSGYKVAGRIVYVWFDWLIC